MPEKLQIECCIAGGGPAGMMLGYMLARAGVDVAVLEKHADFLRDFRGDTIHPSTLEVMHELGILDAFLKRPHQETRQLRGYIGESELTIADFSRLPTRCKFIAFMPQWDFLDFLAGQARALPNFHLVMQAEVKDLLEENGKIVGVRAQTPQGMQEIYADLVIGADGRHSTVRAKAGFVPQEQGVPIDVLWMRLSKSPRDPQQSLGRIDNGKMLAMIDRGDYWQCAFVIHKGGIDEVKRQGLEHFRRQLADIAPFLADRVGELKDWDDIKLLTVAIDWLPQWFRPGLLCIGDAAHAMSPVGGIGINIAIQDAVAAANILAVPLLRDRVTVDHLRQVQKRREWPMRMTQRLQVLIQNRVINRVLAMRRRPQLSFALKLLRRFSFLQGIPARIIGIGFRPEHVKISGLFKDRAG